MIPNTTPALLLGMTTFLAGLKYWDDRTTFVVQKITQVATTYVKGVIEGIILVFVDRLILEDEQHEAHQSQNHQLFDRLWLWSFATTRDAQGQIRYAPTARYDRRYCEGIRGLLRYSGGHEVTGNTLEKLPREKNALPSQTPAASHMTFWRDSYDSYIALYITCTTYTQ